MKWEMISAQKTRESRRPVKENSIVGRRGGIDGECGEGVCMHNIWLLI